MAHFDPKTVTINNGGTFVRLRHAQPNDAKALGRFTAMMLETSRYLILTSSEYHNQTARTRRRIRRIAASDDELIIVAEHDGNIIAMLDTVTDHRRRVRHVTRFGLMVAPDWQGKGMGRALVCALIDWAQAHSTITRIRLHVHADNIRARTLYDRLGFEVEGLFKNAIRYENGCYMDEMVMSLALTP